MNEEMKKALAAIQDPLSGMSAAFARPVVPEFRVPQLPDSVTNPAKWMYTRLVEYIKSFEESLDNDHEVAVFVKIVVALGDQAACILSERCKLSETMTSRSGLRVTVSR